MLPYAHPTRIQRISAPRVTSSWCRSAWIVPARHVGRGSASSYTTRPNVGFTRVKANVIEGQYDQKPESKSWFSRILSSTPPEYKTWQQAYSTFLAKHNAEIKAAQHRIKAALMQGNQAEVVKNVEALLALDPESPPLICKCLALLLPFPDIALKSIAHLLVTLEKLVPNRPLQVRDFALAVIAKYQDNHYLALQHALRALYIKQDSHFPTSSLPLFTLVEFVIEEYIAIGARLSAIEFWRSHVAAIEAEELNEERDEETAVQFNQASSAVLYTELAYNSAWSETGLAAADSRLVSYLELYQDPELWVFAASIAYKNKDYDQCRHIFEVKDLLSIETTSLSTYKPKRSDMIVFAAAFVRLNQLEEAISFLDVILEKFPKEFSLHAWRLKLALHKSSEDKEALDRFIKRTHKLDVSRSEQWHKTAMLMASILAIEQKQGGTPEFQRIKDRLLTFDRPQTYTSSKDLEYEAICARLSTVPHKSVLTEEQQRDIRSILKLDMEELDIAALKKITPLSPNELSNIGVVETEACLMFGDTVAALHNIEAALTASEGTNYDAAHTCIDLLLSINGVKESGLTSEQTRRAITHARDSIRAEGPHFDYLRAIADTSDIAKTASLQALKGWLTLDSTAKGAFDIQMRATTQRCLQLLPPNQILEEVPAATELVIRELLVQKELHPTTAPSPLEFALQFWESQTLSSKVLLARFSALQGERVDWDKLADLAQMPLSDQLRIEIADILLFHGRKVALALQVLRPSESSSIAESTNPVTLTQMIVLFQSILPHLGLTVPLGARQTSLPDEQNTEELAALLSVIDSLTPHKDDSLSVSSLLEKVGQPMVKETPFIHPWGGPVIDQVSGYYRKTTVSALLAYKAAIQVLPQSFLIHVLKLLGAHRQEALQQAFGKAAAELIASGTPIYDLKRLDICVENHNKHLRRPSTSE